MNTLRFSPRPRIIRLDQIEAWLKEEYATAGESFIVNFSMISESFSKGNLHCITQGNQTLAFCTFSSHSSYASINIAAVHYLHRRRGIGEILIREHCKKLVGSGKFAALVDCQPKASESFWRSQGFLDIPESRDTNHHTYQKNELWKPLVDTAPWSSLEGKDGLLELWNCNPWENTDSEPAWSWAIDADNLKKLPIVIPVNRQWRVRWSKQGKIIKEGPIKYFFRAGREASFFFVLDALPVN